jgi:hypothetical protein
MVSNLRRTITLLIVSGTMCLPGCAVVSVVDAGVSVAATAVSTAVSVAGTAVATTAKVGGAAIDAAIPDAKNSDCVHPYFPLRGLEAHAFGSSS